MFELVRDFLLTTVVGAIEWLVFRARPVPNRQHPGGSAAREKARPPTPTLPRKRSSGFSVLTAQGFREGEPRLPQALAIHRAFRGSAA
jgi:hypothetical protein